MSIGARSQVCSYILLYQKAAIETPGRYIARSLKKVIVYAFEGKLLDNGPHLSDNLALKNQSSILGFSVRFAVDPPIYKNSLSSAM